MSDTTKRMFEAIIQYPHGAFSWIELATTDAQAAAQFYIELFGWTAHDEPMGDDAYYTMLSLDGKPVAALYPMQLEMQQAGIPPHWSSYITVDDVDTTTAAVESAGGTVTAPPFDVMDQGRMSVIQDPTGAIVSLWEPRSHIGSSFYQRSSALCWNELYTKDVAAAASFYSTLLGWTAALDTVDNIQYVGCNNGEAPVAVIMPLQKGTNDTIALPQELREGPSRWVMYLGVEDVDASAAKVQALGGTVLLEPTEHAGYKYAYVQDPQGAPFFIIAS